MLEPLLTVKDVAHMLGCSPSTVIRMANAGDIPLANPERNEGDYRYFRRQDILEYQATQREAATPDRCLSAAILSTWLTETARAMQIATLAGWAAGQQHYVIVSIVHSLDDLLQLIWDGKIEAIIVESFNTIANADARAMLKSLCKLTAIKLIEAGTITPNTNSSYEILKMASQTLHDLLSKVLDPPEVNRIVEFSLSQWRRTLEQKDENNTRTSHFPTGTPARRTRQPAVGRGG